LLEIPNIPHESVQVGETEDENVVLKTWGDVPSFHFEPQPHLDIAADLHMLDFEAASRVTGSRFVFHKGAGARLERALFNFMLDMHTEEHDYTEMLTPYLVHEQSMLGTGQLPKFAADAFKVEETDFYLIPTSEVPVTNFYRETILDGEELPLAYAAFSACFRSEAGAAGRDTRGLIRQHQFNKVELVRFVKPEDSYAALEMLATHAETVLQRLELPYRVLSMCTADLGFTAAKKYDLEVWSPGQKRWLEVSSCSNFTDFQARRMQLRYKNAKGKIEMLHTLNGSGLALPRVVAALLEACQQEDGRVAVPEVLQSYMGREWL
jgi:seryl-tRNA synthetase